MLTFVAPPMLTHPKLTVARLRERLALATSATMRERARRVGGTGIGEQRS